MENRYQLTSEEINKILCRSPRSLSASPAEQGLGAQQIKKYFYDFIYYMAQLLNMHLGAVGKDVTALDTGLVALQEALTEAIIDSVEGHASDTDAHADIRESLAEAVHLANVAYNLASGKSKVYVNTSFQMALFELQNEELHQGDFIMVIDKSTPDFVVLDYVGADTDVTEVDFEDVINNSLPAPQVGEMFRLKGLKKVLLAIESGIDASNFATKEDLKNMDVASPNRLETIAEILLEEDVVSIDMTRDDFADVDKVTDLIIRCEIPKIEVGNTADNPLYIRLGGITAAVIGSQANGWAYGGTANVPAVEGTIFSPVVASARVCIFPSTFSANGTSAITAQFLKNQLAGRITSIQIVPNKPTICPIPAGSKIKIEGRVTK